MLFFCGNYHKKELLIISNHASKIAENFKNKKFMKFSFNRKNRSFVNMKNTNLSRLNVIPLCKPDSSKKRGF
jgi:hypothetical protein